MMMNGSVEMRIENTDSIVDLKKKCQKFSIKLWSRMHKGSDNIFIIDKIDYKIKLEPLIPDNYTEKTVKPEKQ